MATNKTTNDPNQVQHPDSYAPVSRGKYRFFEKYGHMDQRELTLEMLYALKQQKELLERNSKNTSGQLWLLAAIPVLAILGLAFWWVMGG